MESMQAQGRTVWWVSFADYEKENRKLGKQASGAASTPAPPK
jgi:hypothetical protein